MKEKLKDQTGGPSGASACSAAMDRGEQEDKVGVDEIACHFCGEELSLHRTHYCENPPQSRGVQPALLAELRKELHKRREEAAAMAHLIVEAGLVPGIDVSCRCEECRSVAVSMDGAGYMTHVKDRWWVSE